MFTVHTSVPRCPIHATWNATDPVTAFQSYTIQTLQYCSLLYAPALHDCSIKKVPAQNALDFNVQYLHFTPAITILLTTEPYHSSDFGKMQLSIKIMS